MTEANWSTFDRLEIFTIYASLPLPIQAQLFPSGIVGGLRINSSKIFKVSNTCAQAHVGSTSNWLPFLLHSSRIQTQIFTWDDRMLTHHAFRPTPPIGGEQLQRTIQKFFLFFSTQQLFSP